MTIEIKIICYMYFHFVWVLDQTQLNQTSDDSIFVFGSMRFNGIWFPKT